MGGVQNLDVYRVCIQIYTDNIHEASCNPGSKSSEKFQRGWLKIRLKGESQMLWILSKGQNKMYSVGHENR